MRSTMRICCALVFLFQVGLSTAADCDFTVVSGNVTISAGTALTQISEKEKPRDLCALEAQGTPKITCGLSSTYFDCKENPFWGDNDGLNVSLIASVDDIVDKPTNKVSFFGSVDCSSNALSYNIESPTNLIFVKIETVNDHIPEITFSSLDIANLPETLPFGDPLYDLASIYGLQIKATDLDTAGDDTSKVQFAITSGNDDSTFTISTSTFNPSSNAEYFVANLYLAKALDYGKHPNYTLTITAKDKGMPSLESNVFLTIEVEPENTVGPLFDYDFYRAVINESLIDGQTHEINMQPEDIHAGRPANADSSSDVIYSILIDDCGPSCDAIKASFLLDQNSAKVTFDSLGPYENINNHVAIFGVKATWNDAFKRSSLAIVSISLPSLITTTASTQTTKETTTSGETTVATETTIVATSTEATIATNSTETSTETTIGTNNTETTTSGSCPTCAPCYTTPTTVTTPTAAPTCPPCQTTSSEITTRQTTSETPYEITNATTTETSLPVNQTTVTPDQTTTAVTTHQTTTTTEMPVPVPNFEFYEIANVALTTLVTSVILVIRFQDDVPHTYRYTATDCDGYHLGMNYFDVGEVTGSVTVIQQLVIQQFCLNVTATSALGDRNYKAVIIDVFNGTSEEILPEDYYEVHINESKEDTVQLLVDLDSFYEEKHMAIYELETSVEPGYFLLNSSTGQLFAIKGLDHETHPVYQLIVSVSSRASFLEADHVLDRPIQYGNLSHNEVLVRVVVDDINDHAPQFDVGSHYVVGITSYVGEGQTVMTLSATDADDTEAFNRIYYLITDVSAPFFVNINSGILRSTTSLDVLQSTGISSFELVVTAANSPDGQMMPNQLHLTIYVLKADEILVIQTRKSGIEFDEISSEIIDKFKNTLNVDVRIIQWETNADGNTVAYIYMLPLQNNLSSSRAKRYATSGDGPIDKEAMLSMIKKNAEILQVYFVTDTAETYDDLPQPNNRPSTSGLIAAVVVLSTILGVILIVGAIVGFLLHRKFTKEDHSYVNNTPATETINNYEYLLPVKTRINTFQGMNEVNHAPKSSDKRKVSSESSNSDRTESVVEKSTKLDEDKWHPEVVGNGIIAEAPTTSLPYMVEKPDAEPELDYLKSILVADPQKDTKRDKPIVKFADDVTAEEESTSTDDVHL